MLSTQQMTWRLRIGTFAIGVLLIIQGELVMASLMFLLMGGIEWHHHEDKSE